MSKKVKKVLIGGGSGLIGQKLQEKLEENNIPYAILTRNPQKYEIEAYYWNTKKMEIDHSCLTGVSHVINLAGAGIADERWTDERKKVIIQSRVRTTKLLGDAIKNFGQMVEKYVSASAIGYYGDTGQEMVDESSPSGDGFLAYSVKKWEESVDKFIPSNIAHQIIRTGVVLSKNGGPIERMLPGIPFGIIPYFGDGKQMLPWIHIDDIANIYVACVLDQLNQFKIINAVAPNPINSKQLAEHIKAVNNKILPVVPVPSFALRIALGEMADVVLDSSYVNNKHLRQANYQYEHNNIEDALQDIF